MTRSSTPTVTSTSDGRLVLHHEHHNLAANLGALVRCAVTRTTSEESCAALLGVSIEKLRQVAGEARVPLVFVANNAPSPDAAPEPALQPKIRWKASGPAMRNRDGVVDMGGTIRVVRQRGGRYTVKYAGEVRGDGFESVEAAKRWASERVATWVAELLAARKAQGEETTRRFVGARVRQERRKRVAAELQGLGVCARAESGRIVLDTYVAEDLIARLRDEHPRPEVQP